MKSSDFLHLTYYGNPGEHTEVDSHKPFPQTWRLKPTNTPVSPPGTTRTRQYPRRGPFPTNSNIPYGRDANQCSNRVFQRGSDGNCSVCRRNEEKHYSREPAVLDEDGRIQPSQGKPHSNGNQYCFWAPVHLNQDMDPSRGENREYGHSCGRWSGQFVPELPLDAWERAGRLLAAGCVECTAGTRVPRSGLPRVFLCAREQGITSP